MSVNHYENFPVASLLMPRHLRPSVVALYRYARSADDIADEGNADPAQRLAALARYGQALDTVRASARATPMPGQPFIAPKVPSDLAPIFVPLAKTIARHNLPYEPFHRLLSAFSQDVTVVRHPDFPTLLDYCARSANPVGELMLHLYGAANPDNLRDSDAICTGLQLVNFWQDVALDWDKGRVYLPQDEMQRFGVTEDDIATGSCSPEWRALMRFQVARARALLHCGAPLARRLPGRVGWELRLVVCGGLRILQRLDDADYDVFRARPTLGIRDWCAMLRQAFAFRPRPIAPVPDS